MSQNQALQPTQAIFRRTHTLSATFAGVPSEDTRAALRKYGFEYRHGNWVKTENESSVMTETEVAQQIAA